MMENFSAVVFKEGPIKSSPRNEFVLVSRKQSFERFSDKCELVGLREIMVYICGVKLRVR